MHDIGRMVLYCIARRSKIVNETIYPIQGMWQEIYDKYAETQKKKNIEWKKVLSFMKENFSEKVSLYCAGKVCNLLIDELYKRDMEECVSYIFDSDVKRAGCFFRGYKIVYPTPKKLAEAEKILICSDRYEDEIFCFLEKENTDMGKVVKITELG